MTVYYKYISLDESKHHGYHFNVEPNAENFIDNDRKLQICSNGIHFCEKKYLNIWRNYGTLYIVKPIGDKVWGTNKHCSRGIKIITQVLNPLDIECIKNDSVDTNKKFGLNDILNECKTPEEAFGFFNHNIVLSHFKCNKTVYYDYVIEGFLNGHGIFKEDVDEQFYNYFDLKIKTIKITQPRKILESLEIMSNDNNPKIMKEKEWKLLLDDNPRNLLVLVYSWNMEIVDDTIYHNVLNMYNVPNFLHEKIPNILQDYCPCIKFFNFDMLYKILPTNIKNINLKENYTKLYKCDWVNTV
jgi:hypothetical protein